jgi:DNA-directed RNA polymerase subunit RPC12/RpoP
MVNDEVLKKEPTTIEFAAKNIVDVVTLSVRCKTCGHSWGIRLNGEPDLSLIPMSKFICGGCSNKLNEKTKQESL